LNNLLKFFQTINRRGIFMSALHLGTEGYSNDGINGKVGIGTAAPQAVLDITGAYTAAGEKVTGVRNMLTINKQAGNAGLYAESIEPVFTDSSGVKACLYIKPSSGSNNDSLSGLRIEMTGANAQAIFAEVNDNANGIVATQNGSGIAIEGRGYGEGSVGGLFCCNVASGYALKTVAGKIVFGSDVGIGVDPPTQKLDVNGNIRCSGNIGIGTTIPSEKLYISGDSARFIIKGVTNTSFTAAHIQNSDGDGVEMVSYGRSASGTYLGQNKAGAAFYGGSPNTVLGVGTRNATPLVFGTNDTERMRITSGGNVGIGNNSPGSKLHVSGTVTLDQTSTPSNPAQSAEGRIYIRNNKLVIQFNDAGTVRYKYLDLTGTGVTWVHSTTAP
jgi:hypothetical protein